MNLQEDLDATFVHMEHEASEEPLEHMSAGVALVVAADPAQHALGVDTDRRVVRASVDSDLHRRADLLDALAQLGKLATPDAFRPAPLASGR